jgi:hypothetical protein
MPKVATISPQNRTLDAPEELKALPAWLVWRYEQHPGEEKPRKVPYYVEGGRRFGQQGSPQDRGKLTAFHMARDEAMRRGFDGVGFALMPDWGITALDFDKCVGPNGAMPHEIVEIIGVFDVVVVPCLQRIDLANLPVHHLQAGDRPRPIGEVLLAIDAADRGRRIGSRRSGCWGGRSPLDETRGLLDCRPLRGKATLVSRAFEFAHCAQGHSSCGGAGHESGEQVVGLADARSENIHSVCKHGNAVFQGHEQSPCSGLRIYRPEQVRSRP